MMEWLLNNPELPIIIVFLAAAVIILWRLHSSYTARVVAENEGYRSALEKRNDMLENELKEERKLRETEWKEHRIEISKVVQGYECSLEKFDRSMSGVQSALAKQTDLLQEIAGLPHKVDELKKDVDAVWQHLRGYPESGNK